MQKQIAVLLPCYNVERYVGQVIKQIPESTWIKIKKLIIVDNSSSDNTIATVKKTLLEIDQKINISSKILLIKNHDNYTLGGSTAIAFKKAICDKIDYVICVHSDGQADPKDLDKFITLIEANDYDFLLGSRLMPGADVTQYSKIRLFFNQLFALYQRFLLGEKIYDLGAYIAFNIKTISEIPYYSIPLDMGYHPHLILTCKKILRRKLRIIEFPISWGQVESTNVNVFSYAMTHLYRLFKLTLYQPNLSKDYSANFQYSEFKLD